MMRRATRFAAGVVATVVVVAATALTGPVGPVTAASPPSTSGSAAVAPRGDVSGSVTAGRGIKVTNVAVSRRGRVVKATVDWHLGLLARPGDGDAHNTRLVAQGQDGKWRTLYTRSRAESGVADGRQVLKIRLSAAKARQLRTATDAVLSVSQQYDHPRDKDKHYERNYVTTTHLKGTGTRFTPRSTSAVGLARANVSGGNCSGKSIEPRAQLGWCDLSGANLSGADLSGADLSDADLSYADLSYADLRGADLRGANLSGANLSGANLYGANLWGANLYGADLSRTDLAAWSYYWYQEYPGFDVGAYNYGDWWDVVKYYPCFDLPNCG